jgi:bis(5'-nucleosyl)-tetraphosphatase (symmetrical)
MATYLIGDVQGCHAALLRLLAVIGFSPSQDQLYLLGDMVNRGPNSLAVLEHLQGLGNAAKCLLGNHDIHLLARLMSSQAPQPEDTLAPILQLPAWQRANYLDWLRHCALAIGLGEAHDGNANSKALNSSSTSPLNASHRSGSLSKDSRQDQPPPAQGYPHRSHPAQKEKPYLLVHAGVLPQWTYTDSLRLAKEVEAVLQSTLPALEDFLSHLYGNQPQRWSENLQGIERLRLITNAFTRLRFCTPEGDMEFESKGSQPPSPAHVPWFEVPGRQTEGVNVVFGHWSKLGLVRRPGLLGLDTGCVWGRELTAWRLGPTLDEGEVISVSCGSA